MKLAAKLMLVFLLAVMSMTAVASYFSVQRAYDRFTRRERELAMRTTQKMDNQLVAAWRDQGLDGLMDAIDRLAPHDSQLEVRWVWASTLPKGRSYGAETSSGPTTNGRTGSRGGTEWLLTRDESGEQQLHVYCPVLVDETRQGALEFTRSLKSLEEQTRDTIVSALTSIGMMAAVALGMVYFAGLRWIARPLEGLIDKTRRAGRGDFSQPLRVRGHDEMSELAGALNQMCDQLASQQEQIRTETIQRLAALEQLRHADRLKTVGRLAAGIAHEMGTPLNVVSGRAALIASGKLTPEELQTSAHAIKSEADRITGIIRQLLDFARQRTARRVNTDARDLIARTLELLRPLAEKRRVSMEWTAGPQPLVVNVDQAQIQQVLTNILVNAIQSMPLGGRVVVAAETQHRRSRASASGPERDYLGITVADEGEGIAQEHLEQIFEPFFTTKDVGEGTGLGLSIAYGIVDDHGGWIDVESQVGRGSRFTVYLPQEPLNNAGQSPDC